MSVKTRIVLFAVLALFATGLVVAEDTENKNVMEENPMTVDLILSKETAYPGENLEATCTVKMKTFGRVVVQWIKKIWNPASPEPKVKQIAINLHVNEEFKVDKRYQATADFDKEKATYTFKLVIKDLKNSDSGQIGCGIPVNEIEILKNFTVYAPITELVMESQISPDAAPVRYVDGSTVVFEEGEKLKFYCKATGGYPAAKMLMTSGDKSINKQFKRIETLHEDEGLFDVTMMAEEFVVDYSLYKKRLGCSASITGSTYEEHSVGIMVNLTGFKPKFLCKESIMVELNQVNFNISCIVRSLPPIEGASIGWQTIGKHNRTMSMGTKEGHYKTDPLPPSDSDEEMVMVLRIDRIFIQHFRKYYFTASNEKGEVTHTVELIQDPTVQVKTGSSHSEATSHMIASLATIILAAMATRFL